MISLPYLINMQLVGLWLVPPLALIKLQGEMNHHFDNLDPNLFFHKRLIRLSAYFAIGVLIIGGLVLAGWQWDIIFLKQPVFGFSAMNPLSAVSFILLAFSFLGSSTPPLTPWISNPVPDKKRIFALILAVVVLFIGLLKIAATLHLLQFSVDRMLFSGKFIPEKSDHPAGRMTVISAGCFILAAVALLCLNTVTGRGRMPSQYMALVVGVLGMFSMLGYLNRVQTFYGIFRYTPMAIHTAICFVFFSLSVLLAHPGKGIMKEFTSSDTGGQTARRLLPLVILFPVMLGYLRLWGYWKGWFSTEFGVTILVSSIVFIFGLVVWYNTKLLNKRDILKKEADEVLQQSEGRYRLLVSSVKDYAIFMLSPAGHIVSWNEGAARIKGYTAEEIIGRPISVFYKKEDVEKDEPAYNLAQARKNGRFEKEGWRIRKDGSAFWANVVFTALYTAKGEFRGYAKVTRDITERKTAEDQIAYMARLMEDISDAIFSTDIHFNIRSWNKAAELLYGYSFSEVKGRPGTEVLRTQMNHEIRLAIREELLKGGYWKGEVNYLKKDDSRITILLSVSSVRNAEGEMDGFVMVCRDISDRKIMEDKLVQFNKHLEIQVKEKTAELTGIFERISDAFIAVDKNFCYTYLNKKAGELIRHEPSTLIGRNVWDIFPDAVGTDTYIAFGRAMDEQKNLINIDYYPPLDLWQENHFYPSPDGLSVFIRDITEQKKREKEITDYKDALDQSSIVSITDQNGIIKRVNENFCRNSKYSERELIGQDHSILNSGYHSREFMQTLRDTIATGQIWQGEICNKAKDGTIYWVDTTIVPFLNEKKEPYQYLAIRVDITERKKKEVELQGAHQLLQHSYEEVRQLASHLQDIREEERAGIAREIHDELGQQLTGIKMDMSWVIKRVPVQDDERIVEKLRGTLGLLDNTIKTVRRIATELRPSILDDLGLIAAIEWQSLEFQKRSGITTLFTTGIIEFKGNAATAIGLFRICQESLTNIARHSEAHKVKISLEEKGDSAILLTIEDDGKGFQTEKIGSKKTLGLLGMKERALMMGGYFDISSQPGNGTALSVEVPLSNDLN